LPILLLAVDVARFPHLFHSAQAAPLTLAELERVGARSLGRVNYHELFVSLDDLEDPDYLSNLEGKPAGVIVSAFYPKDAKELLGGPLYRAVKKRLDGVANGPPDEYDRVLEKARRVWWVKDCVRFTVPPKLRSRIRLDRVYTVLLAEDGDQDTTPEVVEAALKRCYKLADEDRIRALVLHTVAVNPRNDRALRVATLFGEALDMLPEHDQPERLYVSLYKKWDQSFLVSALQDLQDQHARVIRDFGGWSRRLANADLRVFLLLLALCLSCSARYVELRPLGFLAITGAYYAFWKGAQEVIEKLGSDYSKDARFIVLLVVCVSAAIVFRQLTRKVELQALFAGSD
jgi:hypothetical protein